MAEVLAVTASVIATIQIADRVVDLCKFYIESIRDTPSNLRRLLVEISTLKTVLENVDFLTRCSNDGPTLLHAIAGDSGPIEGCRRSITELSMLLPSDAVHTAGKEGTKKQKAKNAFTALAWPLKEKKARKLLEEMMGYKMTISMAMITDSR